MFYPIDFKCFPYMTPRLIPSRTGGGKNPEKTVDPAGDSVYIQKYYP
jgi:hypothetical protein